MEQYKIIKPIMLSFLDGNSQKDCIIKSGILETDGKTVWLFDDKIIKLLSPFWHISMSLGN